MYVCMYVRTLNSGYVYVCMCRCTLNSVIARFWVHGSIGADEKVYWSWYYRSVCMYVCIYERMYVCMNE